MGVMTQTWVTKALPSSCRKTQWKSTFWGLQ